jgi:putative flippase GtrA
MIGKVKALCVKYREILVYLIVGGLTTLVSWTAKFLWNYLFYAGTAYPSSTQNFILSVVDWVAGVAFAYPANRRWVFQSKNPEILKEASGFVLSRLSTLLLNILMMQLLVNVLHINVYVSTVFTAILVIVGNYVFSKLFVFKKK